MATFHADNPLLDVPSLQRDVSGEQCGGYQQE